MRSIKIANGGFTKDTDISLWLDADLRAAQMLIRLWKEKFPEKVIDLTGKKPRKSLIMTRDGFCIISTFGANMISKRVNGGLSDSE